MGDSRKIEGCFNGVLNGIQRCLQEVQWVFEESFKVFSRLFQGSFKGVSRKSQGCFTKVSMTCQDNSKEVSRVF